jgi:type IV secretion system protein VirB11
MSAAIHVLARDATLRALLGPLAPYLGRDEVTEVCVNAPGEVFVETEAAWTRHAAPELTFERCMTLVNAIATWSEQEIGPQRPILSAVLPMGERVQIVLPPVVDPDTVTLSIRRPASAIRSLADYEASGAFGRYVWHEPRGLSQQSAEMTEADRALVSHIQSRRLADFLELAVRERRNIAVVGETGSGKTTLMKTLCQSIPTAERLITIEDVRELQLPRHPNRVHLLYSKGEQGVAEVTPSDLIAASMRMKPDRVLLAELRGAEAFDYLKLLTTGHAGSITSFHAESCALAVERYVFMAKEHPQAAIYDPPSLKRLVDLTIDVTLHVEARYVYGGQGEPIGKARYVSAVRFDPLARSGARPEIAAS